MLPNEIPFAKIKAPPVPAGLRLKARECIAHYIERANREQRVAITMPTCSFDLRGRTAGMAYQQRNHVQLNAVLLVENFDDFISDTIPHEVAHLVVWVKYGRKAAAHGAEWKEVMRRFDVEPSRTHSLDTENSGVATVLFRYRCACQTFELTRRTHPGALAGNRYCKSCKYALQYTGEVKAKGDTWRQVDPAPTEAPHPFTKQRPVKVVFKARPPLKVTPQRPVPKPDFDAPSPAMLKYMEYLGRTLKWGIPDSALTNRRAASEFIDRAKAELATRSAAKPAPPVETVATEPPSEKQLAYARSIAARKKLSIPEEVLASKRAISQWIDANR